MFDEFGDAAGEAELGVLAVALIGQRDFQAFVQESELAEALRKRVETIGDSCENRRIGMERDFRAGLFRLAGSLELRRGIALLVGLFPDFAIAPDFQFQPVGERVDDRDADAVQTAGNFIGVTVEFAAGVQDRHHDFGGGLLFGGVHVDGNTAAVVNHGDAVVFVHGDIDLVAISGHGFVDGIVGDFPDQVVQAHLARGTDVHGGALADGLKPREDFDGSGVVLVPSTLCGRILFVTHESCVSSVRCSVLRRWLANVLTNLNLANQLL